MMRSLRAELFKLRRPAILYGAGGLVSAFAVLSTILIFATTSQTVPKNSPTGGSSVLASLAQLAASDGMTKGFSTGSMFLGILAFAIFLALTSNEFGQGTMRMLLSRQPSRLRMILAKLGALLIFLAVSLFVAEILSVLVAAGMAMLRDVSMTHWFTTEGLRMFVGAYANAMAATTFFGMTGMALALFFRSTPLALGIGLAWLGPLEHIIQLAWPDAGAWFPGLVFDAVAVGGNAVVSYSQAMALSVGFAVVLFGMATAWFVRRDMTS